MRVSVKVHPTIREFIIDTNGSDVITPRKDDILWGIVKYNLETYDEKNSVLSEEPGQTYIYIELLDTKFDKSLTQDSGYIYLNTMFRNFLTKQGEHRIAKELRARFKEVLHIFVMASLLANPDMKQKDAFEKFIEHFHLSNNNITFEMIKKSWDRSPHKKSLFKKLNFCAILF